ncbi:hypothetical protein O59_004174 [Cellvibrio sp. BR]|uniref:hypothetical protein n=1 Tax=Cellvibrio sp. BR TaxID=1134474 RepID=UPI0002600D76|nr:hypothetical protein [Cellvibrio sp. BR]EIK43070.1 hypothetical protein O59_004174 [Cellvibrio sp. BR]
MNYKKTHLTPIIWFSVGLILIVVIDFSLRSYTGHTNNLGLPEALWFSLHGVVGIFAALVFWKNTTQKSILVRLIYFIPLLLAFIIMYTLIIYGYVFGTHIDGF